MKVRLEFEQADLEKMLLSYFEKEGFGVKNLQELVNKFGDAFPEGIHVEADIIDKPVVPVVRVGPPGIDWGGQLAAVHVGAPILGTAENHPDAPVADEEVVEYRDLEADEDKPLSMTDLLDPTKHRSGDADENAQVLSIVQKSQQLERQLNDRRR